MAYADKGAGSNKLVSVLLVVLLHVALGFGLIIGLNYEAIIEKAQRTEVFDVEEEVPEEEPPPPPEDNLPPPPPEVYVPPAPFTPPTTNRVTTTQEKQVVQFTSCPGGAQVPVGSSCPTETAKTRTCPSGQTIPAEQACPDTRPTCQNGQRVDNINECAERQPKSCPAGSVKATVAYNEQCVAKGEDRALQAQGNPGNWVPQSAYPRGPLRDGVEGTVGFTLAVGPDGRPTNCSVTSSSGNGELDSAACSNLMKRAKFKPKLDNGQAVSSSYSNRVRWVIPK
jgi:periplasmic protein TonB